MTETILGVAPRFDRATQYSYKWYKKLLEEIPVKTSLEEENATRSKFEQAVKNDDPDIIIFYDHGNEDRLVAQDGKDSILDSKNIHLTEGRIVYTMACLSAKKLGKEAFRNGCKVYVGYVEVFGFTVYDEELFMEAVNYGIILYVKGEKCWKRIYNKMIEKFNEMIEKATDIWTKIWLTHDRDALRIYCKEMPPKEECPLRRFAIALFGCAFRKVRRRLLLWVLMTGFGLGVLVHDYTHALWQVGGYKEILSPQGGYIGLILTIVGYILTLKELGRVK